MKWRNAVKIKWALPPNFKFLLKNSSAVVKINFYLHFEMTVSNRLVVNCNGAHRRTKTVFNIYRTKTVFNIYLTAMQVFYRIQKQKRAKKSKREQRSIKEVIEEQKRAKLRK